MKCALQEFQHMFPHLTSRFLIKPPQPPNFTEEFVYFSPMECPILPLDSQFRCKDMLHQPFDDEKGPLWRVQLVTQSLMDAANLVIIFRIYQLTNHDHGTIFLNLFFSVLALNCQLLLKMTLTKPPDGATFFDICKEKLISEQSNLSIPLKRAFEILSSLASILPSQTQWACFTL
jgi:hypothetical protein